jgi:hypothetical protein
LAAASAPWSLAASPGWRRSPATLHWWKWTQKWRECIEWRTLGGEFTGKNVLPGLWRSLPEKVRGATAVLLDKYELRRRMGQKSCHVIVARCLLFNCEAIYSTEHLRLV